MTFFGFPKVKWLHLAGEVNKSVRFSSQIFSGFSKNYENRLIFDRVIQKIKGGRFLGGARCINGTYLLTLISTSCVPDDEHVDRLVMVGGR